MSVQIIDWTPERVELLSTMWRGGASSEKIAAALGFPGARNAIIGKVHRLKLPPHINPPNFSNQPKVRIKPVRDREEHGNVGKIKPQVLVAARDGIVRTQENRFLASDAWKPLPGSTPTPLETRAGCAWPVTSDRPYLFCNEPKADGKAYCDHHLTRYRSRGETL